MPSKISPVPEGRPALTVSIVVADAAAAIAFYVAAFGAAEEFRLTEPSGKVGHAELRLGGTLLMLSDPYPDHGAVPPGEGGRATRLHLYVEDVDAAIARAVATGARVERPATDQFYGDRSGTIIDPAGHAWHLASRREDVSPAEMQARWDKMMMEG
ncbi:VOC family protein [Plastoroseomonas hellenica]|uniref:VOC family protein n=1 Tax=Plastoroseomonas hellenica TaxID=2687306 RepID=UPI001BA578B8|nr:VOC family protein [Plastoroseomonas hellenica]MBR0645284.1 VOC family protein [Plastoroseomonas hellenica]